MNASKSVCACIFLLMTGCATVGSAPPTAEKQNSPSAPIEPPTIPVEAQQHQAELASITDFKINGRMGVQSEGYGVSGNIFWLHSKDNDAIDLYSPLGNKIAAIIKNAEGVSLTSQNGKVTKAQDAETLTELTLGWRLPFSKLANWIVGRPANGVVSAFNWDEKGQLSKFTQDGWEISYMQYQSESHPALPSKINLRNPKMNVRIVVENWDTSPQFSNLQDSNTAQTP